MGSKGGVSHSSERVGRLHVVVVVEEEGFVGGALGLGDDAGIVGVGGGNEPGLEPGVLEHPDDHLAALADAEPLRADGRLRGEALQFVDGLFEVVVDVLPDGVVHGFSPSSLTSEGLSPP